jgi:DNA-directed RNA polymerase subunit RPC12/RpoP
MAYECSICNKKLQNPQALQMHLKWKHSQEATKSEASKNEEAIKSLNNTFAKSNHLGSVAPVSEQSDDLEIEEIEPENPLEAPKEKDGLNKCPLCNHNLEDFENPCKSCGAEIEWGE